MRKTKPRPYDTAECLRGEDDMAAYLEVALAEGDAASIAHALGTIARARGTSQLAKKTELRREFTTILRVVKGLGVKLHAEAVPAP